MKGYSYNFACARKSNQHLESLLWLCPGIDLGDLSQLASVVYSEARDYQTYCESNLSIGLVDLL